MRREVDAAFSPAEPGAAPAGGGWERMGPPKELWWRSRDEEDAPLGSWSSSIGVGAACILEVVVRKVGLDDSARIGSVVVGIAELAGSPVGDSAGVGGDGHSGGGE